MQDCQMFSARHHKLPGLSHLALSDTTVCVTQKNIKANLCQDMHTAPSVNIFHVCSNIHENTGCAQVYTTDLLFRWNLS